MKKIFLLLSLGFMLISFASCSDDDKGNSGLEILSYLDGEYSKDNEDRLLTATINGHDAPEQASANFRARDFKTGSITLTNVFEDHSPVEIENIPLQEEAKDDYTFLKFSGNKKVDDTFSFSYKGYVIYGHLYIELSIN